MSRIRSIIIVPESIVDLANQAAEETSKGGIGTFTVPLLANISLDSKTTPDFRACNWQFEGDERAAFELACKARGIWALVKIHDLDVPDPAIAKPSFDAVKTTENVKNIITSEPKQKGEVS